MEKVLEIIKNRKTELFKTNKIETTKKVACFHRKMLLLQGSKDKHPIMAAKYILELKQLEPSQFLNNGDDLKIVQEWLDDLPAVSEDVKKTIEKINSKK
jgi:hypothetical protein